jgi:uncharacterized protein (DUF58 family)
VPTWRLGALAALGSVLVVLVGAAPLAALVGVNVTLAALAVVDAWRGVSPAALQVARSVPGVIPLDGRAGWSWEITNRSARSANARIADRFPPSLRPSRTQSQVVLPPRGQVSVPGEFQPSRRGRFELDEVAVRVDGPWRLVSRQHRHPVGDTIRVYPSFRSREEAELRIDKARILEVGLRSARAHGGGTEFDSLREYGVDDEYRRIDWAATARSGKPIVRTYRAERNQTVIVLLDTGRMMAGRLRDPDAHGQVWGDAPRLDHAMDAVMALTTVSTRLGDRAGLIAFSDRVRAAVAPGHTRDQLMRVTEAMYDLEPELVESDFEAAVAESLTRFRRRALLVVLTELAGEALPETLLPALPLAIRSHLVIVAGVRDPQVARWASAEPAEPDAAYRKAAAVAALDARRKLVSRLRTLGATVVDEPPGRLAPCLADAYMRVKATGRL